MKKEPKIVCLGGGIGTVQLIKGLKKITHNITVVVSMADDGASGGRLRRLYSMPPPGDLINCIAALSNAQPLMSQLLTFRFKGNRWGADDSLGGQKLGNLILVAMTQITGDFKHALMQIQKIFRCHGTILPATNENVSIWAETMEGVIVKGEENIDLGKYAGIRQINQVHLVPEVTTSPKEVLQAIKEADLVIAGPGDLYTTILPLLLVKQIKDLLKRTANKKIYIVNVTNKPFETPRYKCSDYLSAIEKHLKFFPFNYILVNKNQRPKIPAGLNYHYVPIDLPGLKRYNSHILTKDLVDETYPLHHDPDKTAKIIQSFL